jgi:hypothetical protein
MASRYHRGNHTPSLSFQSLTTHNRRNPSIFFLPNQNINSEHLPRGYQTESGPISTRQMTESAPLTAPNHTLRFRFLDYINYFHSSKLSLTYHFTKPHRQIEYQRRTGAPGPPLRRCAVWITEPAYYQNAGPRPLPLPSKRAFFAKSRESICRIPIVGVSL